MPEEAVSQQQEHQAEAPEREPLNMFDPAADEMRSVWGDLNAPEDEQVEQEAEIPAEVDAGDGVTAGTAGVIQIGEKAYEVDPAVQRHFKFVQEQARSHQSRQDSAQARMAQLEARIDAMARGNGHSAAEAEPPAAAPGADFGEKLKQLDDDLGASGALQSVIEGIHGSVEKEIRNLRQENESLTAHIASLGNTLTPVLRQGRDARDLADIQAGLVEHGFGDVDSQAVLVSMRELQKADLGRGLDEGQVFDGNRRDYFLRGLARAVKNGTEKASDEIAPRGQTAAPTGPSRTRIAGAAGPGRQARAKVEPLDVGKHILQGLMDGGLLRQ